MINTGRIVSFAYIFISMYLTRYLTYGWNSQKRISHYCPFKTNFNKLRCPLEIFNAKERTKYVLEIKMISVYQLEDEEGTLGLHQSARLQRQKEVKLSQISLLIVVGMI